MYDAKDPAVFTAIASRLVTLRSALLRCLDFFNLLGYELSYLYTCSMHACYTYLAGNSWCKQFLRLSYYHHLPTTRRGVFWLSSMCCQLLYTHNYDSIEPSTSQFYAHNIKEITYVYMVHGLSTTLRTSKSIRRYTFIGLKEHVYDDQSMQSR